MLDFLGIGAQKGGTTWLYENLRQHPQLDFPGGKEIHFWDRPDGRSAGWYNGLFKGKRKKLQGEITPAYAFLAPEKIAEIHAMNPNMRLIYSVRHPFKRAWSGALMALGRSEMTFEEASDQWFIDHFRSQGSRSRGDYLRCVTNWLNVFEAHQLYITSAELIKTEPEQVIKACCEHLGVDPSYYIKHPVIREKVYAGPGHAIRPSLLPVLHELYDAPIAAMQAHPLLKRFADTWIFV